MAFMKKHHFLQIDFISTVKLSSADTRKLKYWLGLASEVTEILVKRGVFLSPADSLKVSLLICGDQKIKNLNQSHRGKDKVTDVLSFPAQDNLRKNKLTKLNGKEELFLGDLAICFPQAKRQAQKFEIGLWDEFIHLFFHGLLHLIGYDHEISRKEEKLMQDWEDLALDIFSKIKKGA
jgi:probable rRNA maturation factor